MDQQPFRGRAFTAVLMLLTFVVLFVSGIVLYIVPRGRTAHAIDWHLMFLDKLDWSSLHIAFGVLFLIAGVCHIIFNHKPMANYLRQKFQARQIEPRPRRLKTESLLAALVTLFLLAAAIGDIPPVSYLFDLHQDIKNLWEPVGTDGWKGNRGRFSE
jgi:hypothetical protein